MGIYENNISQSFGVIQAVLPGTNWILSSVASSASSKSWILQSERAYQSIANIQDGPSVEVSVWSLICDDVVQLLLHGQKLSQMQQEPYRYLQ